MKRYFAAMLATCAVVGWDAGASLSWANDSSAELAVGGLIFTKNADVSIESEDLTITPDTVTVRYVFLNQSASPVTLTVAFPLPDIDLADGANVPQRVLGVGVVALRFELEVEALQPVRDRPAKQRAVRARIAPEGDLAQ